MPVKIAKYNIEVGAIATDVTRAFGRIEKNARTAFNGVIRAADKADELLSDIRMDEKLLEQAAKLKDAFDDVEDPAEKLAAALNKVEGAQVFDSITKEIDKLEASLSTVSIEDSIRGQITKLGDLGFDQQASAEAARLQAALDQIDANKAAAEAEKAAEAIDKLNSSIRSSDAISRYEDQINSLQAAIGSGNIAPANIDAANRQLEQLSESLAKLTTPPDVGGQLLGSITQEIDKLEASLSDISVEDSIRQQIAQLGDVGLDQEAAVEAARLQGVLDQIDANKAAASIDKLNASLRSSDAISRYEDQISELQSAIDAGDIAPENLDAANRKIDSLSESLEKLTAVEIPDGPFESLLADIDATLDPLADLREELRQLESLLDAHDGGTEILRPDQLAEAQRRVADLEDKLGLTVDQTKLLDRVSGKAWDGFRDGGRAAIRTLRRMTSLTKSVGSTLKSALSFGAGNFLSLKTLATDIAGVGAAAIGLDQIDGLTSLARQADRLQSTPEDLQVIAKAGERTGASFDQITDGLTEFTKRAAEARADGGAVATAFERLGIDPEQFRLQGPLQQLETLDAALGSIDNQADRLFLLDEIAGDVGVRLSGLFEDGVIDGAKEFFNELGGGLDRIELQQLQNAKKAMDDLGGTFDFLRQKVLVGIAPALEVIAERAQDFVAEFQFDPDAITDSITIVADGIDSMIDKFELAVNATKLIKVAWNGVETQFLYTRGVITGGLFLIAEATEQVLAGIASLIGAFPALDSTAESVRSAANLVGGISDRLGSSTQDAFKGILDNVQENGDIVSRLFAGKGEQEGKGVAGRFAEGIKNLLDGSLGDDIRQSVEDAAKDAEVRIAAVSDGSRFVQGIDTLGSSVADVSQAVDKLANASVSTELLSRGSVGAASAVINNRLDSTSLEREQQRNRKEVKNVGRAVDKVRKAIESTKNMTVDIRSVIVCN